MFDASVTSSGCASGVSDRSRLDLEEALPTMLTGEELLSSLARHDESVAQRIVLKADDFRKMRAEQELHVENLFDGRLELQEGDRLATAKVDDPYAALEVIPLLGQGNAVHG